MSTTDVKGDALYAILCGQERWLFKDYDFYSIIFNDDGTGELIYIGDHMWVLGAHFNWKRLPPPGTNDKRKCEDSGVTTLGRIKLEMTLLKTHAKSLKGGFDGFPNDYYFEEEAFQPRLFLIDIQRGDFVADWEGTRIWSEKEDQKRRHDGLRSYERYRLRLEFDRSPYPSMENTKRDGPFGGPRETCLDLEKYTHAVANKVITSRAVDGDSKPGCTVS